MRVAALYNKRLLCRKHFHKIGFLYSTVSLKARWCCCSKTVTFTSASYNVLAHKLVFLAIYILFFCAFIRRLITKYFVFYHHFNSCDLSLFSMGRICPLPMLQAYMAIYKLPTCARKYIFQNRKCICLGFEVAFWDILTNKWFLTNYAAYYCWIKKQLLLGIFVHIFSKISVGTRKYGSFTKGIQIHFA